MLVLSLQLLFQIWIRTQSFEDFFSQISVSLRRSGLLCVIESVRECVKQCGTVNISTFPQRLKQSLIQNCQSVNLVFVPLKNENQGIGQPVNVFDTCLFFCAQS